jgi:hypothetical protein
MKLTVKCPRKERRLLLPTPTAELFLGTDHGPSSAHPRLLQGAPESGRITPEIWGTGESISLAREISNRSCFCGQIRMRDEGKKTWGKPVVVGCECPAPDVGADTEPNVGTSVRSCQRGEERGKAREVGVDVPSWRSEVHFSRP